MASTFRSHFRHPPQQQEDPSNHTARKQSSRIPTKPNSSNTDNRQQNEAAQHVSKLAKRASRTITPSEKTDEGTKSMTGTTTIVRAPHNSPIASRTGSVAPPPEVANSGAPGQSMSRHNNILIPTSIRTPSLISGSSASTYDSPRSNGLRRKPSTIEQYTAAKRGGTPTIENGSATMHTRNDEFGREEFGDSVLGISLPPTTYRQSGTVESMNAKAGLTQDAFPAGQPVTRDITPPVPNYAQSATPSTRYTDSPFSHAPTPSSASSYSPTVLTTSSAATPRLRQQSPTRSRPLVPNRPAEKSNTSRLGLPSVRESSTSSSNSTVKPSESRPAIPKKDSVRQPASAPPTNKTTDTSRPASRGKLTKEKPSLPRQASSASTSKPPARIPPELAHLNVEPPRKPSLNKALPPIRPSRDGTPTLTGMGDPSPVVQSDLPRLYTTYHKRTPSQETPPVTSPNLKARFGLSPKSSSKQQSSPRIDSAISPPPAARHFARGPTPDPAPSEVPKLTRKDSPAIGPSPSKSPRFGFFSRKPKADVPKPAERPKRQLSKGPAAGTGHEGYGRFGVRGRSGSTTSSTGLRSSSADSTTSSQQKGPTSTRKSSVTSKDGSDIDDFLRERLTPVVLRGSGSTVSNTTSGSEQAISPPESSNHSSLGNVPKPQLLPSAMDNNSGRSPSKHRAQAGRTPSDSSEDDVTARYPTLATRRSMTRLSEGEPESIVKVPAPINTNLPSKNSSIDSYDNENSAWPQTDSTLLTEDLMFGKEGLWLRSHSTEPEVKTSRKWNFFQRAQASPRNKGKGKATEVPEISNTTAHQSPYRGVAHYAMPDPVEPVNLEEVERIMQENETSAEDSMSESNVAPKMVPYERRHTSLLPFPPKPEYSKYSDFKARPNPPRILVRPGSNESPDLKRAEKTLQHLSPHEVDIHRSPIIPEPEQETEWSSDHRVQAPNPRQDMATPDMAQVPFNTPENQEDASPSRPPRLSPIGRIPKVVSKRDRDRKLSDSSFSRPFARTQPRPTVKPPGSLYTQIRELASPIESGSQPVSSTSTNSNGAQGEQKSSDTTNPGSVSTNRTSLDVNANNEFFSLPRVDSEHSYSSSSGKNSVMAILAAQPPQEDDVWNEYNDFLDDVMPQRTPLSATSSLGAPFQYSTVLYDSPAMSGAQNWSQPPPPTDSSTYGRSNAPPRVLSVPQQIARFMQPSMSPVATPQASSDVFDRNGNRSTSTLVSQSRASFQAPKYAGMPQPNRSSISGPSRSSIPEPNRSSLPRSSRSSLASARGSVSSSARHSRGSGHSRSASLPEANARNSQPSLAPSVRFNRDTQLLDIAEVDGDEQAAAANLRFGALMTSKWLSFGRVLFSPAHNEMRLADEPRVLIIDGLGSDWSYYVALSYPAATVYNLGPSPVNGESAWPGVNQKPPSNHRHINHAAISAAFPFPKGFFTAVVFRFPIATTDQAYQACIFECKRVLRPGGYLEVAALDLDLMNMGNKARKEVRGLKTRMQQADRNVSLRNLSDVLIRLIGRRGFEEVQRCIVGVPAAGRIPRSQDMSSVNSDSSGKPVWQREDHYGQDFSLADLLEDARANQIGPGKNNDEGITKMVAKVGRWWYSTCYEKALLQSDNSIWNASPLLRECEKQGTSFRLLICYAQKPTQTRRRTVSV